MLLNRIIRQVHKFISQIVYAEFAWTCPQITLIIKVAFHISVDACDQCVGPNIKLALVYQQGVVYVLLNDACFLSACSWIDDCLLNFLKIFWYWNSLATVRTFAWLEDPNVWLASSWETVIKRLEFVVFRIIQPLLYVECYRQGDKGISAEGLIVKTHVEEKSLFVGKMVIIFEFVVDLKRVLLHFRVCCYHGEPHFSLIANRWIALQFTLKTLDDVLLPALCPNEVNFFYLFLVMHHPPVALLEQCPHQHRIIPLTNEDFVWWQHIFILLR